MVKRAPPRKNRTPTKSAKRTKQETLAAARGKQTGVGVKAAKKKETAHEDERGERRSPEKRDGDTKQEEREKTSKGENEGRGGRLENDCQDGGGFFSFSSRAWQPHFE